MQSKLTLRLEESLIKKAKSHAKRRGKSLSQLVADYFALLEKRLGNKEAGKLPPVTRSLKGVLRDKGVSEADYKRHLEDKYR